MPINKVMTNSLEISNNYVEKKRSLLNNKQETVPIKIPSKC